MYFNAVLTVRFYECQTWSGAWGEERRLRVFDNRVLRELFGPKRNTVMRKWRKLYNEELNDMDNSVNIFRTIKLRKKCGSDRRGKSFV